MKKVNYLWPGFIISVLLASCISSGKTSLGKIPLPFNEVLEMGIEGCMTYYSVPGCTWAVLHEDELITGKAGYIFEGSDRKIQITDHFQIGSLGKSFTSLIAAKTVENGLIEWDTGLFSVLPEWRAYSMPEYENLTLSDLLSHRTNLQALNKHKTHIDKKTGKLVYDDIPNFTGSDEERRWAFCQYALKLKPIKAEGLNYGNSGYVIAGCMMEKVTGKTWEELALKLAADLDMDIGFERPNLLNPKQPWGHLRSNKNQLEPISPNELKVYNDPISAPAGNIHVNILDFSKYVRQYMNGLKNKNGYVSSKSFRYLLSGKEGYAMGWYNNFKTDSLYHHYGSERTFYCHMMIFENLNSAIIVFTNAPGDANTLNFINDARNYLKEKYIYHK